MPRKVKDKDSKKSFKKVNKKVNKKGGQKRKTLKGGLPPGSTDGTASALADDIIGMLEATFNTVKYSVETIISVVELPEDIGKAWADPAAPNPSDIKL